MKTAQDIMTKNVLTIGPDTKVLEAAKIFLEKHYNGLPVVDANNKLVGILTQMDLVSQNQKIEMPSYFMLLDAAIPMQLPSKFEKDLEKMAANTVKDLMQTDVTTIEPDTPLELISTYMVETKRYSLPVIHEGVLVGIVGREDVLRAMILNG